MKALIVNKPTDPVDFLIKKLQQPEMMRIVLLRPPGSDGKSLALTLVEVEHLQNVVPISVGDLIDNEIIKRSAFGKEIEQNRKSFSYVKDEIVIELLKLKV